MAEDKPPGDGTKRASVIRASIVVVLAVIAGTAAFVSNIDKLWHFAANLSDSLFRPSATIIVQLESGPLASIGAGQQLDVGISSGANSAYLPIKRVALDTPATFVVPAFAQYTVYWQGSGFLAASYTQLLAPASTIHARLVGKAKQDSSLALS